MAKQKKFSKYRLKKVRGIKHQEWVSGTSEARELPRERLDFTTSYTSKLPRPARIVLPSGKMAWVSRDESGLTKIA